MMNRYINTLAVAVLAISACTVANAQTVTNTITLQNPPEELAVDPIANRIYVAVPNFGAEPYDFLTVIDGKSDKVINNIKIPPIAYAVAVDYVRGVVYVGAATLDTNENEVVAVRESTGQVLGTLSLPSTSTGDGILGLAVNLLTGNLYVSNASLDEVDVVKNLKLTTSIPLAGEPFGLTVNPIVGKLYVALLNGAVSEIDTKSNAITATTPVGTSNTGIAVNLVTGNVFTTNNVYAISSTVGVLDKNDNVLTNVSVGNSPIGIDVDFVTDLIFVANTQDGTISVINGKTNTVTATLPVSGLFVAANPGTEKVYVGAANGGSTVTVISEK